MKYHSILCLGLIVSCSEDTKDGIPKTAQEQEPPISSQYESTKDYISDVGIAHILEEKLEGYELKAAIVNSFQTTLFYYNADLEQLCIRPEEGTLYDDDTMVFRINGKDKEAEFGYFHTEDRENGKIIAVDFDGMTEEKYEEAHDELNLSGPALAFGFKLKQTDTLHFSIRYYENPVQQKVTVTYSPNTGWRSEASEVSLDDEQVTANIFVFGIEPIIEQLRKLPEEDQECIIRTKPHPSNRFTMKFRLDSDYDDFNDYSVEIAVKGKDLWADDQKMTMFELRALIESKDTDPSYRVDSRISLSQNSDDQTVRDLFREINRYLPDADFSIGIK